MDIDIAIGADSSCVVLKFSALLDEGRKSQKSFKKGENLR
jgi:hypothetical protein